MRERPEDHDAVRALLGELSDAPLPPEVSTRLDRTLAELAAGDHDAPVVDLASRRGPVRRRWAAGLAAATVASVVGLGAIQILGPSESSDSATVTADVAADAGAKSESEARSEAQPSGPQALSGAGGSTAGEDPLRAPMNAASAYAVPALRTATFAVTAPGTVTVLEAQLERRDGPAADAPEPELATSRTSGACPVPDLADGDRAWRVRLDRRPGVLVARLPGTRGAGADERVLEAWQCRELARDATVAPRASVIAPA